MRVLVLLVAFVFSAGSIVGGISGGRGTARQGYAVGSASCGFIVDPVKKQNCLNSANVQYAVESQREMVEQQNAQNVQQEWAIADERQKARCDAIARSMLRCKILTPDDVPRALNACHQMLAYGGHPYGQILCYEAAVDCDGLLWCRSH